mmetsp:Transcript_25886/g.54657  ORF Transcript_25886/g.54657 Transcript_25886/m.54657 type:complete len:228 (-) Transcript_25886:190-873(-)
MVPALATGAPAWRLIWVSLPQALQACTAWPPALAIAEPSRQCPPWVYGAAPSAASASPAARCIAKAEAQLRSTPAAAFLPPPKHGKSRGPSVKGTGPCQVRGCGERDLSRSPHGTSLTAAGQQQPRPRCCTQCPPRQQRLGRSWSPGWGGSQSRAPCWARHSYRRGYSAASRARGPVTSSTAASSAGAEPCGHRSARHWAPFPTWCRFDYAAEKGSPNLGFPWAIPR